MGVHRRRLRQWGVGRAGRSATTSSPNLRSAFRPSDRSSSLARLGARRRDLVRTPVATLLLLRTLLALLLSTQLRLRRIPRLRRRNQKSTPTRRPVSRTGTSLLSIPASRALRHLLALRSTSEALFAFPPSPPPLPPEPPSLPPPLPTPATPTSTTTTPSATSPPPDRKSVV